jgi:phenylalanyl-tRNA synthetase beta chain
VPTAQTVPTPAVNDAQRRILCTRRSLAAQGLLESITWSFVTEKEAMAFGGGAPALKLTNPISFDMSDMRPTPLPGLLAALQKNFARGIIPTGLFEIGPSFLGVEPGDEKTIAAWARAPQPQRHWQGAQAADVITVKADVFAALATLGQNADLPVTRQVPSYYHPGRSGALYLGKTPIAFFGELHPEVCTLYDFKTAPVAAEIILDNLPPAKKKGTAKPLLDAATLQPVTRDFAFLVPDALPAADLARAVKLAERNLITDVSVFDVYAGKGMEGEKSIALSVTLQPREKTLTDQEIENLSQTIINAAGKIGAKIR